jgi:hypothetical protein
MQAGDQGCKQEIERGLKGSGRKGRHALLFPILFLFSRAGSRFKPEPANLKIKPAENFRWIPIDELTRMDYIP